MFDENGDCTISTEELGHVMKSLGQELTKDEIQAMVNEVDEDGNGTVDFNEFLTLIVPTKPETTSRKDDLLRAFEAFDSNGDGFISKEELKEGLKIIGESVTDGELRELLKIIDADGGNKIRYTEFVHLMGSK